MRSASIRARTGVDEDRDRAQHLGRRTQIRAMHPQLLPTEADHHRSIAREAAARDPAEPELAQPLEELFARPELPLQLEL